MSQAQLTSEELSQLRQGTTLDKDFFYIPAFYFVEDDDETIEWQWYSLRFNDSPTPQSLAAYTSKVAAGQSIKDAIIRDLAHDFQYPLDRTFVVESIRLNDAVQTQDDKILTRLLIAIGLDEKIDVSNVHPLGMQLHWQYEDTDASNVVADKLGFSIDLYQPQIYIHIPMDGSGSANLLQRDTSWE